MAWRPNSNFVCGELDNRYRGKVTGWLTFLGLRGRVRLDLQGDFHRDIRGTMVRIKNPHPVPKPERGYMTGFNREQTGVVGDMTAGWEPHDYGKHPYFEWYSERNGRVVLEPKAEHIEIVGTPRDWRKEDRGSRSMDLMMGFLTDVRTDVTNRPKQ